MNDNLDAERFIAAQALVIERVREELRAGEKRGHWMWYIFPQLVGLGSTNMAQRYAIGSLKEARAFIRHPVLGARLIECTSIVNGLEGRTAHKIFGSPDDMKFHSSMTLFGVADPSQLVFRIALHRYFSGEEDALTLSLLKLVPPSAR